MANNKKKKRVGLLNLILFILLVILVAILVFWAARVSVKNDKHEIKPKNQSELSAENSSETFTPAEYVDIGALMENFTYVSLEESLLSEGSLGLYSDERPYAGKNDLRGIYESLFNKEGLQIASARGADIEGNPEMLAALNEMLTAFYDESGLRTVMIERIYSETEQEPSEPVYTEGYYDEYGNYIEPQETVPEKEPDLCYEHDSGYAVDLGLYIRETGGFRDFTGKDDYAWFTENAYKYGFILRYPEGKEELTGLAYNPAHFRYVGQAAAAVMREQDMCLEEFSDYIKGFGFDDPLLVQTASGCQVLYYIGDSGIGTTTAQIPADADGNACPYSVSGNNADGYIITVSPTEEFLRSIGADDTESANGESSPDGSTDTN